LIKKAKTERMIPKIIIGIEICKFPVPAARAAINSLSPCIFERPMITPTKAAIGQVKAMTFGTSAKVSCQTRLDGRIVLKKISENRLTC
jgi:hypothetical protein